MGYRFVRGRPCRAAALLLLLLLACTAGSNTSNVIDDDGDGTSSDNTASNANNDAASNTASNASNSTTKNAASNTANITAPASSGDTAAGATREEGPAGDYNDGDPYGEDNYGEDNYPGTDAWAAPADPPYYAQLHPEPLSEYQLLPQLGMIVAVHLVHVPGTDKFLYMERPSGWHPDRSREIAGTFDVRSRKWTHLSSPDSLFCAGHTLMSNGSVAIVGGHVKNAGYPRGIQSIRTFSDGDGGLTFSTFMRYPRWYPTITLLPDEKILIQGGTQGVGAGTSVNPYYEVWDPAQPRATQQFLVDPYYLQRVRQNYFPFNFIMPTGDLFNWCNNIGYMMDPWKGIYKERLPPRPASQASPKTWWMTQFPYTGTAVLLTLKPEDDYRADVLVMGGQDVHANKNLSIEACPESIRLGVTMPTTDAPRYDFNGGWVVERMASPRVMPDATLLPNGVVVLLNGARRGLAGDSASGGGSRASHPNFHAEMYDPGAPLGQRWSSLARSPIARLYHSTAALTTDGTILVTGCDRCARIESNEPFSPPAKKAEYRNEIFFPPFFYDFGAKPAFWDSPSELAYGQDFTVIYTGETQGDVTVTSVVLVAPSSTTHSFNMNQRVVKLHMVSHDVDNKRLLLRAPPNANIAPPQMYMIFLNNGYTYSTARWVRLRR